ncbi:MAG: class F sortase [Dehalococcoidia bacterium]|nr:class F sortase [Dehalococcoidia bacterium]
MKQHASLRLAAGALALVAIATGSLAWQPGVAQDGAKPATPASLQDELRYVGRDPATGMPSRVDDRFIARVERDVERYGEDEREPVPPPPKEGVEPAELRIPALAIDQSVARFGLDEYGRLDVPQDRTTIGWHPAYSDVPGERGSTFFAAHYEYGGQPGVFHELSSLQEGDTVAITLGDGTEHTYRVVSTLDYVLGVLDMGAILQGMEGTEGVTLMTCSGPVRDGNYQWRTLVLAERVD